ncbi:MAG: hypothetical protein HY557_02695 [Euryarchaeota archaeon]|nr:hypothetical protein [Euryarchaeota archaeon]
MSGPKTRGSTDRKRTRFRFAVVRDVPDTYDECVRTTNERVDVERARGQHDEYCRGLQELGLQLIRISADDAYPDCVFVEDPAIVVGDRAIVGRLGVRTREGEERAVRRALVPYKRVADIEPPARLEGGDVLQIGNRILVGLSKRTNSAGAAQLRALLPKGHEVVPIRIRGALHLKSVCAYLGGDRVLFRPGHFDGRILGGLETLVVPEAEPRAANCLAVGDRVMMPVGYPKTRTLLEDSGFDVVEVSITEFEKGGGGVSCLSIRF